MRRLSMLVLLACGAVCLVPNDASARQVRGYGQRYVRSYIHGGRTSIGLKHPANSGDGYRGNTATPRGGTGGFFYFQGARPLNPVLVPPVVVPGAGVPGVGAPGAGAPVPWYSGSGPHYSPKRGLHYRVR